MSNQNYEGQILDAVETIVNNALSKAEFDKTIQATVVTCLDEVAGKYRIKYQDSYFEAYTSNTSIVFPDNTLVNILIPRNDMKQTKIILDAVNKTELQQSVITTNNFEILGSNNAISNIGFSLCSYIKDHTIVLYDKQQQINEINLDELSFINNLTQADGFMCGGIFQTALLPEQQKKGNFGINLEFEFYDNIDKKVFTKSFNLDVNNMRGNPYLITKKTREIKNFQVNMANFKDVKRISFFSKNFPKTENGKEDDIFLSNFELYATRTIENPNGVKQDLNIILSKSYFSAEDGNNSEISIKAVPRLDFNDIKDSSQSFDFYWFKRNVNIDIGDEGFSWYGNVGWECLNVFNTIDSDTGERYYIPAGQEWKVKKQDCSSADNYYKVVAVSSDHSINLDAEINIKNYDYDNLFTIESTDGETFYYDNGNPDLTLKINGEQDFNEHYSFVWCRYDEKNNIQEILEDTIGENTEYNLTKASYDILVTQIAQGEAMPEKTRAQLQEYLDILDYYSTIQRVDGNKIFNLDLTVIDEYADYNCSVYYDNELVGSQKIRIYNYAEINGEYNLIIENGNKNFNYSDDGVAPTNESFDNAMQLDDLRIAIVDCKGNYLPKRVLKACEINWTTPDIETSMITDFQISDDKLKVSYKISSRFDSSKVESNNNFEVDVTYKTLNLHAATAFSFTKGGEVGVNGTNMICRIIPNTTDQLNYYPTIKNGQLNYTPSEEGKWFKVQLWEDGDLVWEGTDSTGEGITPKVTVKWENLANSYNRNKKDTSSIKIQNGIFSYNGYIENAANIIKVTVVYNNLTYYSAIPVITAEFENNYDINLIKNTGFMNVKYSSDGKYPQYTNIWPFMIKVQKMIEGYWEDVSTIENVGEEEYNLKYNVGIKGNRYNNEERVEEHYLIGKDIKQNKLYITPNKSYTGEIVNNAIEVLIKKGVEEDLIGKIHIPVYLYLDRYGLSSLNGWDGNSITLNNEEGFILAPQVGAGTKNSSNQFTGVVMGSVREKSNRSIENGLFGYNNGVRTIFLDAETGKAEFGKTGQGQIILDPTNNKAIIKSGNYDSGKGLLIDLTTPEIKFGNGNFQVNQNGYLTARGGGNIAGWTITNEALSTSGNNLYLGTTGISAKIGHFTPSNLVFKAGNDFGVTKQGTLYAKNAQLEGIFTTYDSNTNAKAIEMSNANITFYNWHDFVDDKVGRISSIYQGGSAGNNGISIVTGWNEKLMLGFWDHTNPSATAHYPLIQMSRKNGIEILSKWSSMETDVGLKVRCAASFQGNIGLDSFLTVDGMVAWQGTVTVGSGTTLTFRRGILVGVG